jgi:hypothetical protein
LSNRLFWGAMSTAELACTYASLILHDDGQEVTVCPRRCAFYLATRL